MCKVKTKFTVTLFFLVMLFVFITPLRSNANMRINIATATTGGSYYPGGIALAQLWSEKDVANASASTSSGSVENVSLLMGNEANVVACQSNILQYAYEGIETYQGKPHPQLRILSPNFSQPYQFVVKKSSNLESISGWKGKKIVVGRVGSGTFVTHERIFKVFGINISDIKANNIGQSEGIDAIRNGLADAAICIGIVPLAPISDALAAPGSDVTIYSLNEKEIQSILEQNVWMSPMTIPAGSYKGLDHDVGTIGHVGFWIVRDDFPEDVAYNLVKAMHENADWLKTAYSGYDNPSFLQPATVINRMPVPVHPGALRYYKEVGLLK